MRRLFWFFATAMLTQISTTEVITDEFIQKFAKGIEDFKTSSQENVFKDGTYDLRKYDEGAAFKNAHAYDFIVVGGGAAGAVVASRLSEVTNWKVLLLEAGEMESVYTQVPVHSGFLQGSKYNWGYLTEPQTTWCLGNVDQRCTAPTGKGLGGGTVINGLIYTRGNAHDYDLWKSQGNNGWSYKEVLPYFKHAEDCKLSDCDPNYHHKGGPLYVEESSYVSPLRDTFLEAGKELGYDIVDYNAKHQTGFAKTQATTKRGRRSSAAQEYLVPHQKRKNLHIKLSSQVIKILVNPITKEAHGVMYVRNNTLRVAKALKEVILSAGPFNSPQLLMLSGIGPKRSLEQLGIPVIQDLPVGKQLRDHAGFPGVNFVLNVTNFEEGTYLQQLETWVKKGKGPMSTAGAFALAFVKTGASVDHVADYPDVELVLSRTGFASNLRIKSKYREVLETPEGYASFRISVMPLHPRSTGSLKLKSKDPFHAPVIDSNFFSDPEGHDLDTMVAGIRVAIAISQTAPFRKLGAQLYSKQVDECKHLKFDSDEYWKCAVKYLSISLRHQIETCKMGPSGSKDAVVDNMLRVHGIRYLRVVDSSIIPVPITGHTHAPANMIGEKAGDIIKTHWEHYL